MGRDVIIACDFNSKEEVVSFLSKFQDEKPFVKIGMELFYAEGPELICAKFMRQESCTYQHLDLIILPS